MQNSELTLRRVEAIDARLHELEARVGLIESAAVAKAPTANAPQAKPPSFDRLLVPRPETAATKPSLPEPNAPASFAPPLAPVPAPAPVPVPAAPRQMTQVSSDQATNPSISTSIKSQAQATQSAPAQSGDSLLDWERLVGGKWALWAGLLSLFCAMASFLAYSWRFIPPSAKVALGIGAGLAFLAAGEWARPRAQRWFGEGLSGAGLALSFLSLWAGAAFFSIFPVTPTFGAMALVVALGVWLAVRDDALGLHVLSVIGGFATPILLDQGGAGDGSLSLLVYLAILNLGVLAVALFKRWRASVLLSFAATVIVLAAWSLQAPIESMRLTVWAFTTFYFLLYVGAACFGSLVRREETAPEEFALLLGASALYALVGQGLLLPLLGDSPGAFALGMALFFAGVCAATARFAPANRLLREGTGALGLLALTVAVPIQFSRPWVGIGWIGEAGILLWLARRQNSAFLNVAGRIVWVSALLPLGWEMFNPGAQTVWGLHNGGWPWVLALAIAGWNALALHRQNADDDWKDVYALSSVAGGAWLLAREVALRTEGSSEMWLVLLGLGVYAVLVFGAGAWAHFASIRLGATGIAAGAAATALWWTSQNPAFDATPFWNLRWASLAGTFGALGAIYATARTVDFPLHAAEKELARAWPLCAFGYGLVAFSAELYLGFGYFGAPDWVSRAFFALSIVWALAALGLLLGGLRGRNLSLRNGAYLAGTIALAALLVNALASQVAWLPFANWRAGAFAVGIVALGVAAWTLKRADPAELGELEREPGALLGAALGLALWILTQETWEAGRYFAVAGSDWQRGAQMAISLVWSLFGALLLLGGICWRAQIARLGALALLAATVCKVFLFDLSFLDGASRALSLAGLGVALVFISWLYGRFGRAEATE